MFICRSEHFFFFFHLGRFSSSCTIFMRYRSPPLLITRNRSGGHDSIIEKYTITSQRVCHDIIFKVCRPKIKLFKKNISFYVLKLYRQRLSKTYRDLCNTQYNSVMGKSLLTVKYTLYFMIM